MASGIPYVVVSALFPKAGSYGSALFLDDSSLISDCLGRSNIPNELFDCASEIVSTSLVGLERSLCVTL